MFSDRQRVRGCPVEDSQLSEEVEVFSDRQRVKEEVLLRTVTLVKK